MFKCIAGGHRRRQRAIPGVAFKSYIIPTNQPTAMLFSALLIISLASACTLRPVCLKDQVAHSIERVWIFFARGCGSGCPTLCDCFLMHWLYQATCSSAKYCCSAMHCSHSMGWRGPTLPQFWCESERGSFVACCRSQPRLANFLPLCCASREKYSVYMPGMCFRVMDFLPDHERGSASMYDRRAGQL